MSKNYVKCDATQLSKCDAPLAFSLTFIFAAISIQHRLEHLPPSLSLSLPPSLSLSVYCTVSEAYRLATTIKVHQVSSSRERGW